MSFFKNLFRSKNKPESITINVLGKDYVIDMSEEAMKERKSNHDIEVQNRWQGKNEIESVRDDGYVIYKTNRVTSTEQEQVGFYGKKRFSEDGKYCSVYLPHDGNFNIALVDVELQEIIYKGKLQRPHRCRVSNNGIVVCEDWLGHDSASLRLYIFSKNGNIISQHSHKTGIGDVFEFIENETKFKYNMNYSGKIHIINI